MNVEKAIKQEFLSYNSKKVKEETLVEFLKSQKKDELIRLIVVQAIVENDNSKLVKIKSFENKTKDDIIQYIVNNLDEIIRAYFYSFRPIELEQLKVAIKNNKKKIKFDQEPLSLHFIDIIKNFSLAKVEYNKKEDTIIIFMPQEFIDIFNKYLKNEKLLEENKYNFKIFDNVQNIVNTYGIINFNKLHEIFNKQIFKIDKNELEQVIFTSSVFDEMPIYNYNGEDLICNLEFMNYDYAVNFYKKQRMNYKIYTKEEYEKIASYEYLNNLKSYQKFKNYLIENYDDIEDEFDYINNFLICDYLNFAQVSLNDAEIAFETNVVKTFYVTQEDIKEMKKYLKDIYDEYPKWLKRGNI